MEHLQIHMQIKYHGIISSDSVTGLHNSIVVLPVLFYCPQLKRSQPQNSVNSVIRSVILQNLLLSDASDFRFTNRYNKYSVLISLIIGIRPEYCSLMYFRDIVDQQLDEVAWQGVSGRRRQHNNNIIVIP